MVKSMTPDPNYYSFLLRLWLVQEDGVQWRASLENVQTGELLGFPDLGALFHYLEELRSKNQINGTVIKLEPDFREKPQS